MLKLSERVLRVFPPPTYLTMPAVGVDLSDARLKWVELLPQKATEHSFGIGTYGELEVSGGAIAGGQIKDEKSLITALREMRDRGKFDRIIASLPEEHAYTVSMRLPKVARHELRESILFSLDQYVPLAPSELTFDYEIIREPTEREDHYELVVTAFPLAMASAYEQAFTAAGLVPLAFEVESQAESRAVVPIHEAITIMVLDLGELRSGISIVHNGKVWFSSTVNLGGKEIMKELAVQLGYSEEDARKEKETFGFKSDGVVGEKRLAALTTLYSPLFVELNKHIDYWNASGRVRAHTMARGDMQDEGMINLIMVTGGEANTPGLIEHIGEKLGIRAERANPWRNVLSLNETIPPIHSTDAPRYTTAIGLALRGVTPLAFS